MPAKKTVTETARMERKIAAICQYIVKGQNRFATRRMMEAKYNDHSLGLKLWNSLCDGSYGQGHGRAAQFYAREWAEDIRRCQQQRLPDAAPVGEPQKALCGVRSSKSVSEVRDDTWLLVRALCDECGVDSNDVIQFALERLKARRDGMSI